MDTISLPDVKKALSICSDFDQSCDNCPLSDVSYCQDVLIFQDVLMARALEFLNFYGEILDSDVKRLS